MTKICDFFIITLIRTFLNPIFECNSLFCLFAINIARIKKDKCLMTAEKKASIHPIWCWFYILRFFFALIKVTRFEVEWLQPLHLILILWVLFFFTSSLTFMIWGQFWSCHFLSCLIISKNKVAYQNIGKVKFISFVKKVFLLLSVMIFVCEKKKKDLF